MLTSNYKNNFEQLNQNWKNITVELSCAVLVYQLLKNANLSKATQDLTWATVSPLIFADIEKQIKAIYDLCYISGSVNLENDIQLSNEVLFSHRSEKGSNANNYWGWNRQKPLWLWWLTTTILHLQINYAFFQ